MVPSCAQLLQGTPAKATLQRTFRSWQMVHAIADRLRLVLEDSLMLRKPHDAGVDVSPYRGREQGLVGDAEVSRDMYSRHEARLRRQWAPFPAPSAWTLGRERKLLCKALHGEAQRLETVGCSTAGRSVWGPQEHQGYPKGPINLGHETGQVSIFKLSSRRELDPSQGLKREICKIGYDSSVANSDVHPP